MAANRHPGITMHKLSFGGGFVGLLFAAGSALIFIIGFPTLWYFVALAFALGVGIAVFLRLVSSRRAHRNKPLSILVTTEKTERRTHPRRRHGRGLQSSRYAAESHRRHQGFQRAVLRTLRARGPRGRRPEPF